jgi:transposase
MSLRAENEPSVRRSSTSEQIAKLEAALEAERANVADLTARYERLMVAQTNLKQEYELLWRKLFVAKAERVDTTQLQLDFAEKFAALEKLQQERDKLLSEGPLPPEEDTAASTTADAASTAEPTPPPAPPKNPSPPAKPTGRRPLRELNIAEERIVIVIPELEGKAQRIGTEESVLIAHRPATVVRVIMERVKYRVESDLDSDSDASAEPSKLSPLASTEPTAPKVTIVTAPLPKRLLPHSFSTPSLLARLINDKFCDGLPFYRQEQRFERIGFSLDRGTMCKWAEECGVSLDGIVAAMKKEAIETAFCIATDATGILIQPEALDSKQRQPCRKGSIFAMLADQAHIVFEYLPKETSEAVQKMLHGYKGYVLADAKSVYDILYRSDARTEQQLAIDPSGPPVSPKEVGCWAHCRRKFFEAAVCKDEVARAGLFLIQKLFDNDEQWANRPPAERKKLRQQFSKPIVDTFFAWVEEKFSFAKEQATLLRKALGYARNQRRALCRFLEDARLPLDNNCSERSLRPVAVGRKAWLFVGSDIHANALANFLSVIASCKLHKLDSEQYLRDIFRILPYWPRNRFLELAPNYWASTRARLPQDQLAAEAGPFFVPPRQ